MENSNSTEAKYRQCYEAILEYISSRGLSSGDQLPTELQLTRMLNVSRITVRRAVTELEEKGVVRKVQGSGTYIAAPPADHRAIAHVPLILPKDSEDAELLNAIQGADKCLAEHSCYLTTHFVHESAEEERRIITQLIDNGTKCIMIFPYDESENQQFFSKIERAGIRLIFLDRKSPHASGCFVGCDNVKGGYLAASHLIRQGYSRIAFLSRKPEKESLALSRRLLGYRDALQENGIPCPEEYIAFAENEQAVAEQFDRLLSLQRCPDAIFCANDLTALDVMRCMEQHNLLAPADMAVMGFDNSCILQRYPLALSTIDQSFYDIGYEAAQIACDILNGNLRYNVHKILPVSLVIRDSTPPKAI